MAVLNGPLRDFHSYYTSRKTGYSTLPRRGEKINKDKALMSEVALGDG